MNRELLERIPTDPGVYLMKDKKGRVLYVGKAKDLRARVRAYFSGGDERPFVALGHLGRLLHDVETFIVGNEKEALLLENNLIKEHQPRFNVKLTDDKQYLVLRIDPEAKYPRVEVGRRIKDDGARYFGPYHSATSARETLRVINRHFQLRTCTDHVLESRKRPCILYQIKRCPAPCVVQVDKEVYAAQVDDACLFLSGKSTELTDRLRERMKQRARALEFEHAAQLRDQLAAVEKSLIKQLVVSTETIDQDVIGLHRHDDVVEVMVLFMRQGKLIGRRAFSLRDQEVPDDEVIRDFLRRYYELGGYLPDEVLLPVELADREAISDWLADLHGRKLVLHTPKRGGRAQLVELAAKNAENSAQARQGRGDDALSGLEKLQQRLSLGRLPRRIECFDIAHLQGTQTVASMVVFVDGIPSRADYRTFKVKGAKNDDFASMYEVIARRFRRARNALAQDEEQAWAPPDLLILDGGKGQLATALAALSDLGFPVGGDDGMDVIALAKERDAVSGDLRPDRVFLRNVKDPIPLRSSSTELFLLARLRDEAHRFANEFHQRLRKKRTLRSGLEDVPGIGPKRRRELLRHFGSLKKIRGATLDELAAAPGMNRGAAQALLEHLAPGTFEPRPETPAVPTPPPEEEGPTSV
jgi:excinuclease ABC subunit C